MVVLYGALFSAFCVWGVVNDVQTGKPPTEIIAWSVFCLVTCYGVFAFALPMLRLQSCARIWRYVAIAIPLMIYSTTVWEIATDTEPMSPIEYAIVGVLFVVVTTPAVVFNILLYQRLAFGGNPKTKQVT